MRKYTRKCGMMARSCCRVARIADPPALTAPVMRGSVYRPHGKKNHPHCAADDETKVRFRLLIPRMAIYVPGLFRCRCGASAKAMCR